MSGENGFFQENIKNDLLNSFNSEQVKKTISSILREKGISAYSKNFSDLYNSYEREAEKLVRSSCLINKDGSSYVLSRFDDDKYFLRKAGLIDRILNFLD